MSEACQKVLTSRHLFNLTSIAPTAEAKKFNRTALDFWGKIMETPAALFPIVLALAAIILAPRGGAQARDGREEGPIEIERCRTIDKPGSYKLVNNLTFTGATGTCLTITVSSVTIDLAGFTITGPGLDGLLPNTTAITAGNGATGITVRNGSNSGFGFGVSLGGDGSIVEGLRVSGGPGASDLGIFATGIVRAIS